MLEITKNSDAADKNPAVAQSRGDSAVGDSAAVDQHDNEKLAKKNPARRFRWQWNARLGIVTILIAVLTLVVSWISYKYHSAQAASTFLSRAQVAEEEKDFSTQAKWLRRYSLLNPGDEEVLVSMALAADTAADHAPPELRVRAIYDARKRLGEAIARLGNDSPVQSKDFRGRLIKRLLQLDTRWFIGAERQIIAYQAESDDPRVTGWLAKALYGQVAAGTYKERRAEVSQDDYWNWLANQNVGQVLELDLVRNPGKLESIERFLDAYQNHPEVFRRVSQGSDDQPRGALKQHVEQSLAQLADNEDSRSKLVLYRYLQSAGRVDESLNVLLRAAERASERLASLDPKQVGESPAASADDQPDHYWDFVIVGEAAGRSRDTNSQQAEQWYDQLIALDLPDIPPGTWTSVFVNAGLFHLAAGNRDRAIEVWELGLEKVGANDLDLLGRLATVRSQGESDQQVEETFERFRAAITAADSALNRMTDRDISSAQRMALNGRLQAARWQLNRVEANLAIAAGRRMEAIQRLEDALNVTVDVDPRERAMVARILAGLHGSEGTWDLATAALVRAQRVAPDDLQLRAEAAVAATRAGNRRQAINQWRVAGRSPSLEMQLQRVQALFDYEMRTTPDLRDFSGVRSTIIQLRRVLRGLESNDSQSANNDDTSKAIRRANARLDILEASLPPRGQQVTLEEHLQSPAMATAVANLAEKYDQDAAVQAFASERLSATGRMEEAKKAIGRLESIVGPDASALAITKAGVAATAGNLEAAAESLMAQAQRDPQRAHDLLSRAANYAQQDRNTELAYRALSRIPDDQQNLSSLFLLAQYAASLPQDSELLSAGPVKQSPAQLARVWQDRLRAREGDSGSYCRFLEVSRIIDQLLRDPNRIEHNDSRLSTAKKLVREILSRRPAWGAAISLGGWLFAIQGESNEAVKELRRGIAAGDTRMQSRFRLWQELTKLGRYVEADNEIRLASFASNKPIEQFAGLRIALAQRHGEFTRGLELAKTAAAKDPQDFLKRLLVCNTALQGARGVGDAEQRTKWIELAKQSVEEAAELAEKDEPAVFHARLAVALLEAQEDAIRAEMKRIENSRLNEYSRCLLLSKALQALSDREGSIEMLERADQLKPTAQLKLQLAAVYRQLNRSSDEVNALRQAQRLRPSDEKISNTLASALVARDGKDVDWDEIGGLLSAGQGVTPSNRLMHAVLLSQQGNERQKHQALEILRELYRERNSRSDDAARALAVLLREQIEESDAEDKSRSRLDVEVRTLYQSLTQQRSPAVVDLFRYASYLIALGDEEDERRIEELRDRLNSTERKEALFAGLDVSVRFAQKRGDQDSAPEIVDAWAQQAIKSGVLEAANALSVAGASLLRLGFDDRGIEYYQRVYRDNPHTLTQYVAALRRAKQIDESIEVCAEHFRRYGDGLSAALMVGGLTNRIDQPEMPEHQDLIKQALQKHGESVLLLVAVANLRSSRADYDGSIELYQAVIKRDPTNVQALNNLAMALSESPGREAEGIKPIEQAIKLAGEIPELLDTKGVALLKSGRYEDAQAAFQQAIVGADIPRFKFHLTLALLARGKDLEAKQSWRSIDHDKLDLSGLTSAERQQLTEMKEKFGT